MASLPRVPAALQRLDDLVVPVLLRGLRRRGESVAAPFRTVARWEEGVAGGRLLPMLHRGRGSLLLVIALVGFVASAVHLDRYPELREARQTAAAEATADAGPGASPTGGPDATVTATAVGPTVGTDLGAYVAERRAALAAAEGTVTAVVSLDRYRSAGAVAALLPAEVVARSVQYRIPAEGEPVLQTAVASGDLVATVARVVAATRAEVTEEEAEIERLLASEPAEEESSVADLEARRSELRAIRNLLDTGAAVVFAVIVEGPADALRDLAGRDGVRLVDAAAEDTDIDAATFYGVRPEDVDVASHGRRG